MVNNVRGAEHTDTHAHNTHTHRHTHTHTNARAHAHAHTHTRNTRTYTSTHMHTHVQVYMYEHTHTSTYMYTPAHTHAHSHATASIFLTAGLKRSLALYFPLVLHPFQHPALKSDISERDTHTSEHFICAHKPSSCLVATHAGVWSRPAVECAAGMGAEGRGEGEHVGAGAAVRGQGVTTHDSGRKSYGGVPRCDPQPDSGP